MAAASSTGVGVVLILGLAPAVCALVLKWLVDDGFLVVSNGQFVKR